MTDQLTDPDPSPFRKWGVWAVLFGGGALVMAFAHVLAPMFEPAPSIGQQIGEIAGDIRRSAWRGFLGLPPEEAAPASLPLSLYFAAAAPILGLAAIVFSLISALKRENWRFAAYGAGLGVGAIVFNIVWWIVLIVAAVIVLVAIIENIGDIVGG
ncbi:MAG: hypothetical protein AAFN79_14125 [Pseudomonadota bacterium]